MKTIDETGNRYGSLVVLRKTQPGWHNGAYWFCLCDCGRVNPHPIPANTLRNGKRTECSYCTKESLTGIGVRVPIEEQKRRRKEKENTPENKRKRFVHHLRYKFGLEIEDWSKMIKEQGNSCAICGLQFELNEEGITCENNITKNYRPHIDHCHDSGNIRGILCGQCNLGLGQFKDNPKILLSAYEYLQ